MNNFFFCCVGSSFYDDEKEEMMMILDVVRERKNEKIDAHKNPHNPHTTKFYPLVLIIYRISSKSYILKFSKKLQTRRCLRQPEES